MRIRNLVSAGVNLVRVELEQVNRSRLFAARRCVDEDRRIVTIHDGVCEIVSANPEVNDLYAIRPRSLLQFCRYLTAKRVVAKKDIPNPGNEDTTHVQSGSTSSAA
jgi:hypothetical protein